eukprot:4778536-Amphidinium_carterae.1
MSKHGRLYTTSSCRSCTTCRSFITIFGRSYGIIGRSLVTIGRSLTHHAVAKIKDYQMQPSSTGFQVAGSAQPPASESGGQIKELKRSKKRQHGE